MFRHRWILATLPLLFSGRAAPATEPVERAPAAKTGSPAETRRFALLVGCTSYASLPVQQLVGPANDVELMRTLLVQKFAFSADQIVALVESAGAAADSPTRPTRANIEREFAELAARVHEGDQVVILLAGHGTQQPEGKPDVADPEPDGLDEVFLPADAQPYDRRLHRMPNVIVDDELGLWVRRIRDRGARVWITVDSCHSGTIVRGAEDEVVRRAPPEKLVPRDDLEAARRTAAARSRRSRGGDSPDEPEPSLPGDLRNIVALYAAQPEQSTVELPLPQGAEEPQRYGLLTFTLNGVLREAQGTLTYRELAQRVQRDYVKSGRTGPTPLLEGKDRDREVLGLTAWPDRSSITLARQGEVWRINAGAAHGLTTGSVLSVSDPAAGGANPLGYVKVGAVDVLSAAVAPCPFGEAPVARDLPDGGSCALAMRDAGLHTLLVYVDADDEPSRRTVADELEKLAKRNPLVGATTDRVRANWVLHAEAGKFFLEPATGIDARAAAGTPRFGPADEGDRLGPWLEDHLRRIARAQNLLALVAPPTLGPADGELAVRMRLSKLRDEADTEGEPIPWLAAGPTFADGDLLGCFVENTGTVAADVTVLFVDSGYGIRTAFPRSGTETENRIYPGESPLAFCGLMNADTVGLEHLMLIAVPGTGTPIDFGAIEQPTLPQARGEDNPFNSPLGLLLQTALYTGRGQRGSTAHDLSQQVLELRSWRVRAKP
jgi:hypothetical protein